MVFFPNAKVNLGLHVLNKLPNGYHTIETVMYPIPLCDILEISMLENASEGELKLHVSGLPVPGETSQNLISKAHGLIANDYALPPLQVHLHKQIPMGAGIGGGSADAAMFIESLNQLPDIQLSWGEMHHYAKQTGSDCPFFLMHQPCLATGTGTDLDPVDINLKGKKIMLVHPGIHLSTSLMYAKINPAKPLQPLQEIINADINLWKQHLHNDFEAVAFALHPQLAIVKAQLYEMGAIYASMSGSGSTFFGIFETLKESDIESFTYPTHLLDL